MKKLIYLLPLLALLASCYRTPTEDDYCLIPSTNNPSITRQIESGLGNGMSY